MGLWDGIKEHVCRGRVEGKPANLDLRGRMAIKSAYVCIMQLCMTSFAI